MKKFLGLLGMLTIAVMLVGCNSCNPKEGKHEEVAYHDYDGVAQDFTAGVSHIQALHRQTMLVLAKQAGATNGYQWRNSRVVFNDTLTLENIDDVHVVAVNDVFFYWNEKGPWVQYINSHVKNGVQIPFPINDVWIEDADMSNKEIKLSAEDAIKRLKEWNGVLPQGCNSITLRYPVGPKDCNPQWVFGDVYDVLFIDAVTGEVRDYDPAFKK